MSPAIDRKGTRRDVYLSKIIEAKVTSRLSTPFIQTFLLMPFPKVHPLGRSRVPGLGGFACFGLSPPLG
jgi:hypothetical protein